MLLVTINFFFSNLGTQKQKHLDKSKLGTLVDIYRFYNTKEQRQLRHFCEHRTTEKRAF